MIEISRGAARTRAGLRAAILCLAFVVIGVLAGQRLADAAHVAASTAPRGTYSYVSDPSNSHQWWNWDLETNYVDTAGGTNVDNPMTMVFTKNATVDKVKQAMASTYSFSSNVYAWGKYGLSSNCCWLWDYGVKTNPCYFDTGNGAYDDTHIRLYGNTASDIFDTTWGYYVVGSTHYDINECPGTGLSQQFGWNEDAETDVTYYFSQHNYVIKPQTSDLNFGNVLNCAPYGYCQQGNHYYQSDGYLTRVEIP